MKAWPFLGIVMMQVILAAAHWFLYRTLSAFVLAFLPGLGSTALWTIRAALILLAFSFMASALLSFRTSTQLVRIYYYVAAVWLGLLNFFFLAACLCWLAWYALRAVGLHPDPATVRPLLFGVLNVLALLAALLGMLNALWIRTRRITVSLPNLPESWHGRRAVMLSDLHLGNVNAAAFCRRVVRRVAALEPEVVFIPGDIFDGPHTAMDRLVEPLRALNPPLGIYFSSGNHEEFGGLAYCHAALTRAGVHVLENRQVIVEGVRIAGLSYGDSTFPLRVRSLLEALHPDRAYPAILLNHVPTRLPIVEQAGFNLQLSGHTHGGQVFPFTWFTWKVFGPFTHGLRRFGALTVYTSTGTGTWGPPMRVGSAPEIVLLQFEPAP